MPFTFEGLDNEFAASTGSNVNSSPNSSRFDNPPQGSKDLRITTLEGDDDPRLFEVGDAYNITWGGQVGGGSIANAVVIRSDPSPDGVGTGIIVFEGIDANGELAQIIWTPGFDLEQWYADNYNPSAEPEFYTQDMDASYSHSFVCFASETQIRSPKGLIAAGKLRVGDLVTTKDAGDVAVLWTGQRICAARGKSAPVVFEQGALGNNTRLRLSQQHRVLIRSPAVQYYFGLDEVFVPAKSCVNGHDIRIVTSARICYVHLLLEQHHVIWADGLECESLFLGDHTVDALYGQHEFFNVSNFGKVEGDHDQPARPVLKMKEAQVLMQHLNCAHGIGRRQRITSNFDRGNAV